MDLAVWVYPARSMDTGDMEGMDMADMVVMEVLEASPDLEDIHL